MSIFINIDIGGHRLPITGYKKMGSVRWNVAENCRAASTNRDKNKQGPACEITFRIKEGIPNRLISACHLSRPEHYLSIYQSGCNMDGLKCHSWSFSQHAEGEWYSPDDIAAEAEKYSHSITCREPRSVSENREREKINCELLIVNY